VINAVGFLDTETGSALGCGRDWPLCHGKVIPALTNLHVDIEFAHRALVGGFALIAAIFVLWAYLRYRRWAEVRWLSAIGIGFILIQSVLGALAVIFVNPPEVLALHLGFGLMAMVGVALLAVFLFQLTSEGSGLSLRQKPLDPRVRRWLWATWIGFYVVIYWGSFVAFVGAGAACPAWPLCGGWQIGPVGLLAAFNLVHRLLALALFAVALRATAAVMRLAPERVDLRRGSWFIVLVLILQGWSGAHLVWNHLATGPDLLHVVLVMILFSVSSYLVMQAMPYRVPGQARSAKKFRPRTSP
jgi:cytochrome c oxidase assembly protein subunit 15